MISALRYNMASAQASIEEITVDGEVQAVVAKCGKFVITLWWRKGYVPMPEHVDMTLFKWKKYRPVWYQDAAGDGHLLWSHEKILYNGVPKVNGKKYGSQWHLPHIMKKAFISKTILELLFRAAIGSDLPNLGESPQCQYLSILFRRKWSSIATEKYGFRVSVYTEKSSGFTAILITPATSEPTSAILAAKSPKLSELELLSVIQNGTKIRRIYNPAGINDWYMSPTGIVRDRHTGRKMLKRIEPRRIHKLFEALNREFASFSAGDPRSILPTGCVICFNHDGTVTSTMTTRTWSNVPEPHVRVVTDSETRLKSGTVIREILYDSAAESHNKYLPPVEITWSGRPDKLSSVISRAYE